MRPATRSQDPQPATPQPPPPRRSAGRKRKAPADDTQPAPTPDVPLPPTNPSTAALAPELARKTKKKRTTGPSAAPAPEANDPAPVVSSVPLVPSPAPIATQSQQPMVIDPALIDPPPAVDPTRSPSPSIADEDLVQDSEDEARPGDATRNRNQRAPTLREENTTLAKANTELTAKVKQLTMDLRILKKYKVMWVKEYSKKARDDSVPDGLIPRPPGEKGKNGWNLQESMGLKDDDSLYNEILRAARHCISRSGLDWEATYSEQEPGRLAACFKELRRQHPYLDRFQGDWPAKEMVISALQNRRKALSAKAKAKVSTDQQTQAEFLAAAATADDNI